MKSLIRLLCLLLIAFSQTSALSAKPNNKSFCTIELHDYEEMSNCWKKKNFSKQEQPQTAVHTLYQSDDFLSELCNHEKKFSYHVLVRVNEYENTLRAFISLFPRKHQDKVLSQEHVTINHPADSSKRIHPSSLANWLILHHTLACKKPPKKSFLTNFIHKIWIDSIMNYYRLKKPKSKKNSEYIISINSVFEKYESFLKNMKPDALNDENINETLKLLGELYTLTFRLIEQINLYEWENMPQVLKRATYHLSETIKSCNKCGVLQFEMDYRELFQFLLNKLLDQIPYDREIDELYKNFGKYRSKNKTTPALVIIPIILLICICLYKLRGQFGNSKIVGEKITSAFTKKARQYATLQIALDALDITVNEIKSTECEIQLDPHILKIYSNRNQLKPEMNDMDIIRKLIQEDQNTTGEKIIETLQSLISHIRHINAFLRDKLTSSRTTFSIIKPQPCIKLLDKTKHDDEYKQVMLMARRKIDTFRDIDKREYATAIIDALNQTFGHRPHKAVRELEDMMKILTFNNETPNEAMFTMFIKQVLPILQAGDLTRYEDEKQKIARNLKKL